MRDFRKRLVEVEAVLKQMSNNDKNKIPNDVWEYIEKNKDTNYSFKYDDNKKLSEQDLNPDTIAILTYINLEYLVDSKLKEKMKLILKKDWVLGEEIKKTKFLTEDLFN